MCPHLHTHLHIQARLVVHACHQNTEDVEARKSRPTFHHSEFKARVDYMEIQNKNINKKLKDRINNPWISVIYIYSIFTFLKIYFVSPESFQYKLHPCPLMPLSAEHFSSPMTQRQLLTCSVSCAGDEVQVCGHENGC